MARGVVGALADARPSAAVGGLSSSMIYSGARPWHGTGIEVPAGTSAVSATELDPVQFSDLAVLPVETVTGVQCPFGAVVRLADGAVIGSKSVGLGFQLDGHQPRDLAALVDAVAGEAGASVDTMGTLAGGQLFWAQATVPGLSFDVGTRQHPDAVSGRLTVMTGHTGILATQIGSCATRIVCENAFMHALGEKANAAYWRTIRHVKGSAGQFASVSSELAAMRQGFDSYAAAAARMVETPLSYGDELELLRVLVPDPAMVDGRQPSAAKAEAKRAAILGELATGAGASLPSADGTAWGLFQAVTAWSTWAAPAASTANRWQSALLGDGAALSQQAFALLSSL